MKPKHVSLASEYKAGWNNGDITVPNRLANAKDCATNDSRPDCRAYWQGVTRQDFTAR